jgi:quercetin dioxygenase-like cupin family protein
MAMERQRVRERLPERERREHDYDWNEARAVRWERERALFDAAPRVIKYDAVPWEQVQQAYHKIYSGDNLIDLDRKLRRAPLYSLSARLQVIEPGRKSGMHRHYHEALFYILEGQGHETHDGKTHQWGPGDLMIVPPYCVHQHVCDEGPAKIFYILGGVYTELGIGTVEQIELHGDFRLPEGAKQLYDQRGTLVGYRRADGQNILFQEYAIGKDVMERRIHASGDPPTHAATDPYEHYVRLYEEETHWRLTVPHIIHPQEQEWHDTRQGHIKWFIHPQMVTGLRGYEAYLQELPPGGWSGKHTHVGEEVHYIIEGHGYEVIDGKRWDWEAGDVVAIPVCSTHQSFNADPAAPARFLAARQRLYEYYSYGGVEHHEDASPWPD